MAKYQIVLVDKDVLLTLYEDSTNVLVDEQCDSGRWYATYRLVVKHEGNILETFYRAGLTENQDCEMWDDDIVTCNVVVPYEKTVVAYKRIEAKE